MKVLIVGHGLAGSTLANSLINSGHIVDVVDACHERSSSRIAAGVIKPITGQRIVKSWNADTLIPMAVKFYRSFEQLSGSKFFEEKPMFQVFSSPGNRNDWMGRLTQPEVAQYCQDIIPSPFPDDAWDIRYGGIFLRSSSQLNIPAFLNASEDHIKANGRFIVDQVDSDSFNVSANKVEFQNVSYDKIVFCNGINGSHSKINCLYKAPISPVKGEILNVRMHHQLGGNMLSGGVYIVPTDEGQALVGATYEWNNNNSDTSEKGLHELEVKLGRLFKAPYTIEGHSAATRPASPDRKPIGGFLDDNRMIGIVNGFGSKGVMFAPFMAEQMRIALETGEYPDKETDIRRFLT